MGETLEKLRPDRDLQCYFQRPSAVAALSETSATGFTVSGSWRQQFDWAVVEWNRDNVFEHPAFRNLPDGDLSGLELTYDEVRTGCIPMDSDLFDSVKWSRLRVWREGQELPDMIPLIRYAVPVEGEYVAAWVEFELQGAITAGDYIGVAWLTEQYNYQVTAADSLETAVAALAAIINAAGTGVSAAGSGARLRLTAKAAGANWNRAGAYGFVSGARTEWWAPWWQYFSGGASPVKWRVHLDFDALTDENGQRVDMSAVRKMRWTYAAEFQRGEFQRTEFQVVVSNWQVSGTNRGYLVAGPGSRRIEDDDPAVRYTGAWQAERGNYSGGSIRYTTSDSAGLRVSYRATGRHLLYLGTRKVDGGGGISVSVDGGAAVPFSLAVPLEDVLVRIPLGEYGAGEHTVAASATGPAGNYLYFDFLEIAVPAAELPVIEGDPGLTLATDWDTDHSICLAPERTAWMISSLGFRGRANHYAGAMWFYELIRAGHQYASAAVEFVGNPPFIDGRTTITIGRIGNPLDTLVLTHVHCIGDTAETVAKWFEEEMNRGYTSIRAEAQGNVLTIFARAMGSEGNQITVSATPEAGDYYARVSGPALSGGTDGDWRTDVAASPRLNRAARDWSRSFFGALRAKGIDATAAFSMELQHGDPSEAGGIAQRCPAGDPVLLPTPAVQTNFSPESTAFWKQVYREMAELMEESGIGAYLQFGEVQWWYFREGRSGMPYYDAYTKGAFQAAYGREMATITENTVAVADYPEEAAFLPTLIGQFTSAVMEYVRQTAPGCRFEVLYPLDVNETEWNRAVNYPAEGWTPEKLDCLKTENFGFTYARDVDKCRESIRFPGGRGFAAHASAHLVGIGDYTTPWEKEAMLSRAAAVESTVLFALDQFCLIGYEAPLKAGARRSLFQG
jgi:hypothetical protein